MLTEAGKPDYALPDDFGGLTFLHMQRSGVERPLLLVTAEQMQHLLSEPTVTGPPLRVAIIGNRLWLHPTPDASYYIQVIYQPKLKVF